MALDLDPIWLLAFLLGFVRALAWLMVMPPFSNRTVVPRSALIGIAGGLSMLAVPEIPHSAIPTDTAGLIGSIVLQVFTGVALGFSVQILLSAVTAAGAFVDQFGGLNLPPSMDPLSGSQAPIIGQLYEQVALILLFISNGELLLVKGFVTSFGATGITFQSTSTIANVFTSDLATFFVAALEIGGPMIAVLFAAQVGLALLSKAAPQMNVWVLGFPSQIMLSLLLVAVGVRVLPGYVNHILSRTAQDMTMLMKGH